ncbi:MAG: hypothetical protein ACLTTZ_01195 [Lachnospiraceae bacterium]
MGIIVENPGIQTTVQDEGRFGYQQFGVSPAGPMDTQSFYLANILAGTQGVKVLWRLLLWVLL